MAAPQLPEAFGRSVTVEDTAAARRCSTGLYAHDRGLEGVFGGTAYPSSVRDGETLVNILQKGEGNPLADVFPTRKVASVAAYTEKIAGLGGSVVIPASRCPCTETPFAVCADAAGNRFMVKEPRGGAV